MITGKTEDGPCKKCKGQGGRHVGLQTKKARERIPFGAIWIRCQACGGKPAPGSRTDQEEEHG